MLHLTNGDAAATPLRAAGLPGDVIVWADVLHDGPAAAGLGPAAWRDLRVGFLAEAGYVEPAEAKAEYERWDAALGEARGHDELVLWFEHDLFDQLLLVRHLDWLVRQSQQPARVSLVCIDRHPAVRRFTGLGQLEPGHLAALFPMREPVGPAHLSLGARAWNAFVSPDPTAIERLIASDTRCLPFLAGALGRLLEEYPSVHNGLPRTEGRALDLLARSPAPGAALFRSVQETEERPFMGDTSFYARLRALGRGAFPLVEAHGASRLDEFRDATLQLTSFGRQVLEGRADWISWNGIDRWLGGVHLHGEEADWRWDAGRRRLIASARS